MGFFDALFGGPKAAPKDDGAVVASPVSGTVMPLSEVNDPVFSGGMMGKGCGIKPSGNTAYAPVSGQLTAAFPTGHAYGIMGDNGVEVLVHVGLDTVTMEGKGFSLIAKQGDQVKAGDPLGTFSSEDIQAAGLDDTVILVVTNSDDFSDVALVAEGTVENGAELLKAKK